MEKLILVNETYGTGLISIPVTFVRALGWYDSQKLYVIINDKDEIVISDRLSHQANNVKSIFNIRLNKVKRTIPSNTHRMGLNKYIMSIMGLNKENRRINIEKIKDKIVISKI